MAMKKQQIRPVNSNNAYDVIVTGGGPAGDDHDVRIV